jgi:hypothetical protein
MCRADIIWYEWISFSFSGLSSFYLSEKMNACFFDKDSMINDGKYAKLLQLLIGDAIGLGLEGSSQKKHTVDNVLTHILIINIACNFKWKSTNDVFNYYYDTTIRHLK